MRIGVFDSGLGGLFVLKALVKKLPNYNFLYLGDTANLPYGNKSQKSIYKFTRKAVDYLFQNDCQLILLACNTASARALRKIQQQYLPKYYPKRRVLGVIIPTAEVAAKYRSVGILATEATVKSESFVTELLKLNPKIRIKQSASPRLVSLIESQSLNEITHVLPKYLKKLANSEAVILGCTHYPIIRPQIQKIIGKKTKIISQTDIIPNKLINYLHRHPEIDNILSKKSDLDFRVTKLSPLFEEQSQRWFGKHIKLKLVRY